MKTEKNPLLSLTICILAMVLFLLALVVSLPIVICLLPTSAVFYVAYQEYRNQRWMKDRESAEYPIMSNRRILGIISLCGLQWVGIVQLFRFIQDLSTLMLFTGAMSLLSFFVAVYLWDRIEWR